MVGDAEGWGNTVGASGGFVFWMRTVCDVELYNIGCQMTLHAITPMDNEDGLLHIHQP